MNRMPVRGTAIALIFLGVVWLLFALFFPIYVEPGGAGSLDCGWFWQMVPSDSEVHQQCTLAVDERRRRLPLPVAFLGAAVSLLVVANRRARPSAPDPPSSGTPEA